MSGCMCARAWTHVPRDAHATDPSAKPVFLYAKAGFVGFGIHTSHYGGLRTSLDGRRGCWPEEVRCKPSQGPVIVLASVKPIPPPRPLGEAASLRKCEASLAGDTVSRGLGVGAVSGCAHVFGAVSGCIRCCLMCIRCCLMCIRCCLMCIRTCTGCAHVFNRRA